ncbi:MAG: hypothetical protein HZC23_02010 [Rhodocyclales bacterium]|nr:hypothetical protein [Rhodocyclales bacterium]
MLADVPAQLLALLRRKAALPALLTRHAILLAALEFLVPPEFALLLPLKTSRMIAACRLCVSRQARHNRHENACK